MNKLSLRVVGAGRLKKRGHEKRRKGHMNKNAAASGALVWRQG